MRQSLPYVTGAFSLLIEQSAIWVMYWAIHKGYAGLRIMITVAHTRLIVALLVHYFRDSYSRHMRRSVDGNRQDNIGSARATRTGAQGEERDGGGRRLQAG